MSYFNLGRNSFHFLSGSQYAEVCLNMTVDVFIEIREVAWYKHFNDFTIISGH